MRDSAPACRGAAAATLRRQPGCFGDCRLVGNPGSAGHLVQRLNSTFDPKGHGHADIAVRARFLDAVVAIKKREADDHLEAEIQSPQPIDGVPDGVDLRAAQALPV